MGDFATVDVTVPRCLAEKVKALFDEHGDGEPEDESHLSVGSMQLTRFTFLDVKWANMDAIDKGYFEEAGIPFDMENETGSGEIEAAAESLRYIEGEPVNTSWFGNARNPDIDILLEFLGKGDIDGLVDFISEHAKATIPPSWTTQEQYAKELAAKLLIQQ